MRSPIDEQAREPSVSEVGGVFCEGAARGEHRAAAAMVYRWPDRSYLLDIYSQTVLGFSGSEEGYQWGDYVRLIPEETGPRLTRFVTVGAGLESSIDEPLSFASAARAIDDLNETEGWAWRLSVAMSHMTGAEIAGFILGAVESVTRANSPDYHCGPVHSSTTFSNMEPGIAAWPRVRF